MALADRVGELLATIRTADAELGALLPASTNTSPMSPKPPPSGW
ncbi:hypothetical protein [Amycolatopsis nalaikhensis]|uniref:Uncharacterized protein n=1 Tax=Amycolatopsis nalaikhensis TaxID=715472 RepID=A0ABY8XRE1_9PSEU|nr:hypothetical protein [Amycolatopsis sp. 2-2]WIV58206.1 hypothetical protein QP939_05965 [Amycolatopsis sp. 2-2]